MAATPSTMLPLGTIAPPFSLPDTVSGKTLSSPHLMGPRGTLVIFICNHCPYVIHMAAQLAQVAREYQSQGVSFVAISANDVENYPDDAPDKMTRFAAQYGFDFPYLYDESQAVARAYQAACTPDLFLFDGQGRLVYRGQFDSSRPKNGLPVDGKDLRNALKLLLAGQPIPAEQTPSIGCNIKWKAQ